MHLHWLRDRNKRNEFHVIWKKSRDNGADYFTKVTFPTTYHRHIRPKYIKDVLNLLVKKLNVIQNVNIPGTERVC